MKRSLNVSLSCLAIAAASCQFANAYDITIYDPHQDKTFGGSSVPPGPENNTVEYNAISNQTWDLEKFDLTGNKLAMVGGFNYLTGQGTESSLIAPMGDIFVYLNQSPYTVPSATDNNGPWGGKDNWSYVIHFDRSTTTANAASTNIRETSSGSGLVNYWIVANGSAGTEYYTGGSSSLKNGLPWLVANPSGAATGTASLTSYGDGEGTHYSLGDIDLSSIFATSFDYLTLHATMECGNDVLWGRVPDSGATLMMLGVGLTGLGLMRRRVS